MKNTNKHLDDLFAAARREEPVISEDHACELLSQSEHMQLPSKLISIKGAIMTSIGLSVAAVTAYVLLSGSPAANHSHTNPSQPQAANLLLHPTSSNTNEPKKSDPTVTRKIVIVKKGESVPTPPQPPQPPSSIPVPPVPPVFPVLVTPPLKVTGITPLTLASEKFAKMGISKKDDGRVSFYQKNENGHILTMSFPQNSWGIIIENEKQENNIEAPRFGPLIVTDTKGNRRMMQFSGEKNGIEWRNLQVESRRQSDRDVESDSTFDPDAVMLGESKDIIGDGIKMIRHKIKNVNKESKVVLKVYTPEHNHLDSTIDRANHFAIDTNGKSFGERMEWMKEEMQIRIRRGDNEDSLANLGVNIGKMLSDEMKKESNTLDHLVPILVRTSTSEHYNKEEGITFDDGLIFWYNPDKELLAAVPEANNSQSSTATPSSNNASEIISSAAIYPNPAKNETTLRFTLSEPRTIAFTIHDLLGKRVLDGGSVTETTAGSYEKSLNVAELTEGVYLLVMTTDKGEQSMQRLVIKK